MLLCLAKYIMYTLKKLYHIIYFKANRPTVFSIRTGSSLICTYINVNLKYINFNIKKIYTNRYFIFIIYTLVYTMFIVMLQFYRKCGTNKQRYE